MSWFRRRAAGRCRATVRPQLEQLEDRRVPAVTYHGGPLLSHVAIEPLFIGSYWNTSAGAQQASQLDAYLSFLSNSSYMDMLNEYNVGRGGLLDNGFVDTSASGAVLADTTIRTLIDRDIQRGALQPPNPSRLYVVFTAPNVDVTYQGGDSRTTFLGYHDSFTDSGGQSVCYAVLPHPIGNGDITGLNDFQTLTNMASHEVAEAATDPDGTGWYDTRTGEEIGDLAQGRGDSGTLNGYDVQGEWSAQRKAAVLPAGTVTTGPDLVLPPAPPAATGFSKVAGILAQSDEFFAHLVEEDYAQLLGRTPGQGELNYWLGVLKQGGTDEQVLAGFVSSPEYYRRAGGTNAGWINALYRDVLGRAADPSGESFWLGQLATGVSRSTVALAVADSAEHEALVVARDYGT